MADVELLRAENKRLRAEVVEWKRVAAAQAELHGEAEADRLLALIDSQKESARD